METKNIELIESLTETIEFKALQTLGLKIHDEKRKFDLLTIFQEQIDEMAWSKLFAYLLDSTQNHELSQKVIRQILERNQEVIDFKKSFASRKRHEINLYNRMENRKR